MKFILGKKIEMTQRFLPDGTVVPATKVKVEPNVITQIKTTETDSYNAIQLGFGRPKNVKKPQLGHLKGIQAVKVMREFRLADSEQMPDCQRGDLVMADVFEVGDKVKVTGITKGKGFQGVVKRHGFHGSPASHGHKDQLRMPGSIGATDAARVFKGKKMPGQMGNSQSTVTGLEVVEVDNDNGFVYVKGAIPGARNSLVLIIGPGDLKVAVSEVKIEKVEIQSKNQTVDQNISKQEILDESTQEDNLKTETIKDSATENQSEKLEADEIQVKEQEIEDKSENSESKKDS